MSSLRALQGSVGGRGGHGGGCIGGVTYYQGKILDTGSPYGGPPPSRAAQTDFVNMNALYQKNNLVLTSNAVYVVPAKDNVASGTAYQTLTACRGPGFARREYSSGFYDVTHKQDGCANAYADAVNKNGQNGTGLCGCGFRRLNVTINGKAQSALVDTGTGKALISSQQVRLQIPPSERSLPSSVYYGSTK